MRAFAAKPLMFLQKLADIVLDIEIAVALAGAMAAGTLALGDLVVYVERAWVVRARRWLDVYKYAAIGFVSVVLVGPWLRGKLTAWFSDGTLPTDGSMALFIGSTAIFLAMLRARPTAVGKLKKVPIFPPWWVAVWLAHVFACGYWRKYPASWHALMPGDSDALGLSLVTLGSLIMPIALVFLLIGWDKWREADRNASQHPPSNDQKDWLLNDDPILSADKDLFGHTAIAKRIADRLSAPGEPSPVAVIGGFGTGKSSVRNLTIEQLKKAKPWVVVVPVSAWPYDSASALVAGILERVIGELASRAGWEALRHVPAAYREAVEGSAGPFGKVFRILERPRTPDALLREIDDVALALNVRVVVWVEDLERFGPVVEDGLETPAAREKLEPVRALLHQLQELRHMTIVIATTRLAGFDLEKLARFIEIVPSLSHERVLQKLHEARSEAMALAALRDLIDPIPPKQRERFDLQPDSLMLALRRAWDPAPVGWADALVMLSPTPRTIKQGLRDFRETWEALAGDVDIDHTLGASILRNSESALFQALASRAAALRSSKEPMSICEKLVEELKVRTDRREALIVVLQHLFGADSREHLQGFGTVEPADYWARFLSRTPIADTDSDQVVLRALRSFAADSSGPLVDISMRPQAASAIRAFESLLPTPAVLDLLDAQLCWIQKNRPTWLDEKHPPSLNDTWIICIRRAERAEWSAAEAFNIVDKHVQLAVRDHNLRLADWLLYWFGTLDGKRIAELLSTQHRRELRDKFVEAFLKSFGDHPDALASALDGAEPWLLHRLCYGVQPSRKAANDIPFTDWPKLSKTLVAAAQSHPREILPQLTYFLTRISEEERSGNFALEATIDRDAMNRLFPNQDILSPFARYPGLKSSHPDTQARLIALRAAAQAP